MGPKIPDYIAILATIGAGFSFWLFFVIVASVVDYLKYRSWRKRRDEEIKKEFDEEAKRLANLRELEKLTSSKELSVPTEQCLQPRHLSNLNTGLLDQELLDLLPHIKECEHCRALLAGYEPSPEYISFWNQIFQND